MDKNRSNYRPRRSSKHVTTRSGRVLKVNQTIGERWNSRKLAKSRRKVERLIGLPKSRFKRLMWRLHPKRLAAFWFSRDGAITALKGIGILIIVFFILTLGVFAFFRKDLPKIGKDISGSNLGGSISYYDRTGQHLLFQDYNAIKRVPVKSEEISKYLKDATIAVEDKDFYKHRGFDIKGITRAAINDITHRSARQGGSTLTQQLVKLTQDWTEERTFTRKAKELILAVELERTYTKDEILTGYLNAAPYGGVIYGAQSGASDYFNKSAKELTLAESAFLAAIPKSPAIYSPYNKELFQKEALTARSHYVLDQMVSTGKITKKEAEDAKKVDVLSTVRPQQTKYAGIRSPYFVLAAKKELESKFIPPGQAGQRVGGWKVITTMDMNLQNLAEEQVRKGLSQIKRQGGDVAAFVAEDVKTGQMVSVVGGVDFNNEEYGKINYAQWPISPGSSFKPYDYLSLIENSNNVGAGSVLYDTQSALPGWPCTNKASGRKAGGNCLQNYDFRYPGPLTLRYALGGSRNVPAVKAMLIPGVDKTIKVAESIGLKSGYKCFSDEALKNQTQCYGSAAIGDGAYLNLDEHVNGFATLSRMGSYIPHSYILSIQDAADKPRYKWKQPKANQAVRKESAYIVTNMLQDPNASYFPANQKIHRYKGWNFGLKTGTTNDAKDGLLMGMSSKYAAGVWVGYHTRQKEMSGFMETMTRPIWNGWMTGAHSSLQPENWTEPSGIQKLPAYVVRSHVGVGSVEPTPATEIYPSWYKPKTGAAQSSVIDKVSNKLATSCTPAAAKQTVGGSGSADFFSVDTFVGRGAAGAGANTGTNDDVHSCGDAPPTINLTANDGGGGNITITAFVRAGTHPFNNSQYTQFPGSVTISVNGQTVKTSGVNDPEDNITHVYSASSGGTYTITATVTDSVLYSASDTATLNLAGGGTSPPTITSAVAGGGGMTTINWIGGTGPYTVRNGAVPVCSAPAGSSSCSGTGAPKNSTVTLTDSNGLTSSRKVD